MSREGHHFFFSSNSGGLWPIPETPKTKETNNDKKESGEVPESRTEGRQDREVSFATWLDTQMMKGVSFEQLLSLSVKESEKRGLKRPTLGALQAHARYRAGQRQWTVRTNKGRVKLIRKEGSSS